MELEAKSWTTDGAFGSLPGWVNSCAEVVGIFGPGGWVAKWCAGAELYAANDGVGGTGFTLLATGQLGGFKELEGPIGVGAVLYDQVVATVCNSCGFE